MLRAVGFAAVLVALAALLGVASGSAHPAQNPTLVATVGPGFTITLRDAQGRAVTKIDPGTYDIEVRDLSEEHNFHLIGPGVNRLTSVEDTGTEMWTVAFTEGSYRYVCDPHSSTMRGSFTVGDPPTTTPPPSNVVTPKTRLVLTSGPKRVVTLRTAAGKAVKTLKRGTYRVTVRDRSRVHNARLRAPGFNRATAVRFRGTQQWRVRLSRTGTLRFLCDPHSSAGMRGTARIVR